MNNPEEQEKIRKIREYISKSGFPLEIEIGNILRKEGWLAGNQWPYTDKTTGKIRLVDVLGMKMEAKPPRFLPLLFIECKKSVTHGWAFYTQEKEKEFLPALVTIVDFVKKLANPPLSTRLEELMPDAVLSQITGLVTPRLEALGNLSKLHFLDKTIKIGVACAIPSGKRDDFFEAKMEIASALESLGEGQSSSIVFPVIVFDGDMFEFYQEDDQTKISPINHIQVMEFRKNAYPCLIDVVRKPYFSEFLKKIEQDFSILTDFLKL
jgi:hypothetical protein